MAALSIRDFMRPRVIIQDVLESWKATNEIGDGGIGGGAGGVGGLSDERTVEASPMSLDDIKDVIKTLDDDDDDSAPMDERVKQWMSSSDAEVVNAQELGQSDSIHSNQAGFIKDSDDGAYSAENSGNVASDDTYSDTYPCVRSSVRQDSIVDDRQSKVAEINGPKNFMGIGAEAAKRIKKTHMLLHGKTGHKGFAKNRKHKLLLDMQLDRSLVETPYAIKLSLLADAYPVVLRMVHYYDIHLTDKDPVSIQAKEHLRSLANLLGRKCEY